MRAWRICCLCLALLAILSLGGCGSSRDFDAGEQLTAQELAALQDELAAKEENEKGNSGEQAQDDISDDGTVYWLESGKVYHRRATCYHIAKKDNVQSGTAEQASAAGKERLCASCGGD